MGAMLITSGGGQSTHLALSTGSNRPLAIPFILEPDSALTSDVAALQAPIIMMSQNRSGNATRLCQELNQNNKSISKPRYGVRTWARLKI
jgi:hypothetical protein